MTVSEFLYEFIEKYGLKKWRASTYDGNNGLLENYVQDVYKRQDRRHADKWLGPERIAELENLRRLKEKERKEQPVQLSLLRL